MITNTTTPYPPIHSPSYTIGNTAGGSIIAQQASTILSNPIIAGSNGYGGYTIGATQPTSTIVFKNNSNKEIVRLNMDGTVTWANGIDIDEAAYAFGNSLQLGAERGVGITAGVKRRMRDTIFQEMIEMAKIKGPLTADDLTYMLSAAKIMDKLKGGYE